MNILLAVDGSFHTKRMLAYVAAHDEWLGPQHQYTLIHCVPAVENCLESAAGADVARRCVDEAGQGTLKPIRAFFLQHGIEPRCIQAAGDAGELIAETARNGKYDLLVMGSHGQGQVAGVVLGSVVTKVLAKCSTPLLVIR